MRPDLETSRHEFAGKGESVAEEPARIKRVAILARSVVNHCFSPPVPDSQAEACPQRD